MRSAACYLAGIALAVMMLDGCGGKSAPSTPTAPTPTPPQSVGAVDSALVGTWNGSLEGGFGPGTFTMTLAGTGTVTTVNTGGSSNYCAISGDWGVGAGQFTARGSDCTGTVVTLRAPSSNTRLSGTWSATSGRSGTFDVTK
jgi:hypothetical protein